MLRTIYFLYYTLCLILISITKSKEETVISNHPSISTSYGQRHSRHNLNPLTFEPSYKLSDHPSLSPSLKPSNIPSNKSSDELSVNISLDSSTVLRTVDNGSGGGSRQRSTIVPILASSSPFPTMPTSNDQNISDVVSDKKSSNLDLMSTKQPSSSKSINEKEISDHIELLLRTVENQHKLRNTPTPTYKPTYRPSDYPSLRPSLKPSNRPSYETSRIASNKPSTRRDKFIKQFIEWGISSNKPSRSTPSNKPSTNRDKFINDMVELLKKSNTPSLSYSPTIDITQSPSAMVTTPMPSKISKYAASVNNAEGDEEGMSLMIILGGCAAIVAAVGGAYKSPVGDYLPNPLDYLPNPLDWFRKGDSDDEYYPDEEIPDEEMPDEEMPDEEIPDEEIPDEVSSWFDGDGSDEDDTSSSDEESSDENSSDDESSDEDDTSSSDEESHDVESSDDESSDGKSSNDKKSDDMNQNINSTARFPASSFDFDDLSLD